MVTDRSPAGEKFVAEIAEISSVGMLAFIFGGVDRGLGRGI